VLWGDPFRDLDELIRRVYAYVAYRIGDGPDADDVTSETFARAFRRRETYDPAKGPPIGWLLGIARRCISEELSERPTPVASVADVPGAGAFEDGAMRRVEVARAVATLPPRDRELVALRYGGDLTARQIGELVGMRTNAVEVALHRALAQLRPLLAPESAEELPAAPQVAVRVRAS
jgi:RNA polymerase sigma factor (sigma-70 family)